MEQQKKRIIPCLDMKDGRVVKGTAFVNLRDAGDPAEYAKYYCEMGADALALLDIMATQEGRSTMLDVVKKVAACVTVPFTVGGGVGNLEDINALLQAGADKVLINSAAVKNPVLLSDAVRQFGGEKIVCAIDVKRTDIGWEVYTGGGKIPSGRDALEWAQEAAARGVGEILLTSIDCDGEKTGYDLAVTRLIADNVAVPVVASGGAGTMEHFYEALTEGGAEAALAASLFHFREIEIPALKQFLREKGVSVYGADTQ